MISEFSIIKQGSFGREEGLPGMRSLGRLAAITGKEFRHIRRDFRLLLLVTLSPPFLLVVLAYLFALDVRNINLVVVDQDRTPVSRQYIQAITADGTLKLRGYRENYAQAEQDLFAGKAELVIVIPPGFERELHRAGTPAVQAVADGMDSLAAQTALQEVSARTLAFVKHFSGFGQPVAIRSRAWYNPELKSLWSMVPGLMAIVLCLPTLAFTLSVKREEEQGSYEMLLASPMRPAEYQLGKLLAYACSGLVSAMLVVGVAALWFQVPLRGSLWMFLLLTAEYYLASMGIALVIARVVTSQQTAMFLVLLLFFIPGFFIAGLILPVNTRTLAAQLTAYALPVTHFLAVSRCIFLKGAGLGQLRFEAGMMGAMAMAGLGLSLLWPRRRLC